MEISIIIPVYNKARYLRGVLEDLRRQSFGDFECILIDDGSGDGSGAICDELAASDARFRVRHIRNGGVSNARNLGLELASGEYVTFIDGDDRVREDYLKSLRDAAVRSGADMVVCGLERFWEDSSRREKVEVPRTGVFPLCELLRDFVRIQQSTGIYGFISGKLVRRGKLASLRFDTSIRLAEDLDFYLSAYPRMDRLCLIDGCGYSYLQAAENSSMLDADDRIDYYTQLGIQLKLWGFLREQGALSGENRELQAQRIYDYVYLTLFHARPEEVSVKLARLRALELPDMPDSSRRGWRRQWILGLYSAHGDRALAWSLRAYKWLRRALRRR